MEQQITMREQIELDTENVMFDWMKTTGFFVREIFDDEYVRKCNENLQHMETTHIQNQCQLIYRSIN